MTMPEQPSYGRPEAEVGVQDHGADDVSLAAERLSNALSRLEALVERRATQNDEMAGELQRLRQRNEELKALLEKLAGRVDVAVARLEEVLKE